MALFTTFGMQKDDNIIFVCGCFRTRRYAKRWFPKDGVRRVTSNHLKIRMSTNIWIFEYSHSIRIFEYDFRIQIFAFFSFSPSVFDSSFKFSNENL